MPDATEEAVERLERNLAGFGAFSRALEAKGVEGVIETILAGLDRRVLETSGVRFRCRCARETLLDRLTILSEEDKRELADPEGRIEAECAFCAAHYLYNLSELDTQ